MARSQGLTHKDYPITDCMLTVAPLVAKGCSFRQKFTCSSCGARQTMEKQNVFFESGTCEECGALTDIRKTGCNYMLEGPGDVLLTALMQRGAKR